MLMNRMALTTSGVSRLTVDSASRSPISIPIAFHLLIGRVMGSDSRSRAVQLQLTLFYSETSDDSQRWRGLCSSQRASSEETAAVLNLSSAAAMRNWTFACALCETR